MSNLRIQPPSSGGRVYLGLGPSVLCVSPATGGADRGGVVSTFPANAASNVLLTGTSGGWTRVTRYPFDPQPSGMSVNAAGAATMTLPAAPGFASVTADPFASSPVAAASNTGQATLLLPLRRLHADVGAFEFSARCAAGTGNSDYTTAPRFTARLDYTSASLTLLGPTGGDALTVALAPPPDLSRPMLLGLSYCATDTAKTRAARAHAFFFRAGSDEVRGVTAERAERAERPGGDELGLRAAGSRLFVGGLKLSGTVSSGATGVAVGLSPPVLDGACMTADQLLRSARLLLGASSSDVGARLTAVDAGSASAPGISPAELVSRAMVAPGTLTADRIKGVVAPERGGTGASNFYRDALLFVGASGFVTDPALRWDSASNTLVAGSWLAVAGAGVAVVFGEASGAPNARITFLAG